MGETGITERYGLKHSDICQFNSQQICLLCKQRFVCWQKNRKCNFGMKISSISVALCRLVAGVSLIYGYSRSLISLVVSLVFSPRRWGRKLTPWWTNSEQMEQTNRSSPRSPVTGQVENWCGRLTVHIMPAMATPGSPVTLLTLPHTGGFYWKA